jgi:hypothetical protein
MTRTTTLMQPLCLTMSSGACMRLASAGIGFADRHFAGDPR